MARIKHRTDNIHIFDHHLNILPRASSASVPTVCTVYVDSYGSINIFASITQKRDKRTFLIHGFISPSVGNLIHVLTVRRESYVIELNLIESAAYQFLCDCDIVFPNFRAIRVYPVFIVI